MFKLLFAAVLFIGLSAGINAQSKDCCSKDKKETSSINKHCDVTETVSTDSVKTTEVAGALTDEKNTNETKVVTKEVKMVKETCKDEKNKECCTGHNEKKEDPKK
jgi:hypothetical protein